MVESEGKVETSPHITYTPRKQSHQITINPENDLKSVEQTIYTW